MSQRRQDPSRHRHAAGLVKAYPGARVACLGLAFKANIDAFRESPARFVAASLARKFGDRIKIVEPFAAELPREFEGTGAELIDMDTALENCGILTILVDHDVLRVVPAEERGNALVYDNRGIWNDTARPVRRARLLLAS